MNYLKDKKSEGVCNLKLQWKWLMLHGNLEWDKFHCYPLTVDTK